MFGVITRAIDRLTESLIVIPYEHHELHEGKTYQASYKSPDGAQIADNETIRILLITGARYCHTTLEVHGGGDAELSIYEASTTSGGTALQAHNMNRNGLMTPSANAVHTPTIANSGLLIHNSFIPGGSGPQNSPGGTARPSTEWILKPNTKYLFEGTNRAGSSQDMSIVLQWYEKER